MPLEVHSSAKERIQIASDNWAGWAGLDWSWKLRRRALYADIHDHVQLADIIKFAEHATIEVGFYSTYSISCVTHPFAMPTNLGHIQQLHAGLAGQAYQISAQTGLRLQVCIYRAFKGMHEIIRNGKNMHTVVELRPK